MSGAVVHISACRAPNAYVRNLTPGTSGVDLSTVTSAVANVKSPTGTETTWTLTRSNQTASTLTVTHVWTLGEVTGPGNWVVEIDLTIPSGVVTVDPETLTVYGKFEVV